METQRDAFLFYRSYYDAVKELNKRDRAAALLAICEYGLYGTEPELTGAAAAVWILVRPTLDANARRYINGRRGGRPKANQTETKGEPEDNQSETKPKPKDNQTESKPKGNKGQGTRDKGQGIKDKGQETRDTPGGAPSLSEIEDFCLASGGTSAAAAAFYAQYSAAGWQSNGKPIANWRGLLTNFLRQGGGQGSKGGQSPGTGSVPSNARRNAEWMRRMLAEDDDGDE